MCNNFRDEVQSLLEVRTMCKNLSNQQIFIEILLESESHGSIELVN